MTARSSDSKLVSYSRDSATMKDHYLDSKLVAERVQVKVRYLDSELALALCSELERQNLHHLILEAQEIQRCNYCSLYPRKDYFL